MNGKERVSDVVMPSDAETGPSRRPAAGEVEAYVPGKRTAEEKDAPTTQVSRRQSTSVQLTCNISCTRSTPGRRTNLGR